jgi:hypothetical protein
LGSVIGLLSLGSRYGMVAKSSETVAWVGNDNVQRKATIPAIYFFKDQQDGLARTGGSAG